MELKDLGFDDWFTANQEQPRQKNFRTARVTAVNRDNYLVRNEVGEVLAELSGEFLFSAESNSDLPVVGDWASVQYYNDNNLAIIYNLYPRKTVLRRKTAGKKIAYQMIAANIDTAFIVQSCDANFNLRRLERYLVMVRDGDVEPVILLSKSDLVNRSNLEQMIAAIRNAKVTCDIIPYSSLTGEGVEEIQRKLEPVKTYCLLGSSGVGKTTLLNNLMGREAFDTNPVREKDGKGRHTTARRQIIVLDGGSMLVDTPGIRELGNIDAGSGIGETFADIQELAAGCRFNDCTHTGEAGCAVLEAVKNGDLNESRYQSYLKLRKESEYYQMSYFEKRDKDRKFSKFIKSAGKQIKKFKRNQ